MRSSGEEGVACKKYYGIHVMFSAGACVDGRDDLILSGLIIFIFYSFIVSGNAVNLRVT